MVRGRRRTHQAVTVDDLNSSFRGDVYGERPAMDAHGFRAHVERNDVDLARSRRWTIDGALAGVVLLAFRGDRAWVGGFGVVPEFRGRGLAREYLDETLAVARESGAASVELEVLTHNVRAVRLYERAGFDTIDEVVVWTRAPSHPPGETRAATAPMRAYGAGEIAALARTPASSWQREPASVAAGSPFETLFVGADAAPDAYAFVRRGERASMVDARAHDPASAGELLAMLDARFGAAELSLVNEPARGALHDAFTAHAAWREFGRQYRMRIGVR
jgi:ribosomal protein S18 acetylase RimI-like enzyme